MGGGDSKPEEQQHVEEVPYVPPIPQQPPKGKKNKGRSQIPSPNLQQDPMPDKNVSNNTMPKPQDKKQIPDSKQKISSKKDFLPPANARKRKSEEAYPNQIASSDQFINQQQQQERAPDYFEHWNQKFHTDGSMRMKVMVLTISPTANIKKLQKKTSQHFGVLSWNYQKRKVKGEDLPHLRIIFEQDGGYHLNFLVNDQSDAVQGDPQIWDLICPFRTKRQTIKIGGFDCQRTYDGTEEEIQGGNEENTNQQLFLKWQQKVPQDRRNIKQLLQKRRLQQKLRSNQGIQYRQTSKYFINEEQWVSSMLIEQRFNSFKCWMIESVNSSPRANEMSDTLRNDVENRQNMYVQQMSKKKALIREGNKKR